MIELATTALTAGFPDRPDVLRGIDLEVEAGSRLALLGANGSGKTTLLRCLSGAHRAQTGAVLRRGETLNYSRSALREHRRFVQLVLQDPDAQLFSADVTQDVSFGPLNLGLDEESARQRVAETLELLGISHLADRPTHQLSYGERKRVAIAGAVAMRPSVLLLDEPTAGLDPAGVVELLDALARMDSTLVLATHDVELAFAWADQVAVVNAGRLVQGSPMLLGDEQVLAAARLRRPWQLEVLAGLGIEPKTPPRTPAEVAQLITSSNPTELRSGPDASR